MANVSLEVVFGMFFLTLSSVDIDFLGWKLTEEALLTTRRIERLGKKEFATVELDLEYETYVVHIGSDSFVTLPGFSSSSYKSPRRVYRLCRCIFSGLGFPTPQAHWDQQSYN